MYTMNGLARPNGGAPRNEKETVYDKLDRWIGSGWFCLVVSIM